MNNFIQLSNINKSFDAIKKIKVLKKISYKFKKGKIYSLMGPSGSGKSTLLNLLSLIDRPSSGSLIIEEVIDNKGTNIVDKIKVGDRFITPHNRLDVAKKRVFYSPKGKK